MNMKFLYEGEQIDEVALAARERDPENDDWLLPVPGEFIRVLSPVHGVHSVMTMRVRPDDEFSPIAHFSPDGHWDSKPSGCGFCYHELRKINEWCGEWFPLSCIKTKARLALEELGARL